MFLLFIPSLRAYVISILSWLWEHIVWCWEMLITSYYLPGWVWLITGVLALIGLINIYIAIKGDSGESEYKKYVEDLIYGAKWRWDWRGNNISNTWCFCPTCDATLVYDDSSCRSFYASIKKTDFICENCNNQVIASVEGGNKDYAIGAAEREINRRIRTGEYEKH